MLSENRDDYRQTPPLHTWDWHSPTIIMRAAALCQTESPALFFQARDWLYRNMGSLTKSIRMEKKDRQRPQYRS